MASKKNGQILNEIRNSPEIIGDAYYQIKLLVSKYAKRGYKVLFAGESGTGKDLLAQHYAYESERQYYAPVNCAGISDTALQSELFGHTEGSYTGAVKKRDGILKRYDKGVVFLDEIGDASEQVQAALLRVIEYRKFKPFGSDDYAESNALIIAATNKPQNIRSDFKDRFHIFPVPPLQHSDIPAILKHRFKEKCDDNLINEALKKPYYPGNVRELISYAERCYTEQTSIESPKKKPAEKYMYKTSKSPSSNFNYYRFRQEFETWHNHIQPIIDKYDLPFRYKYLPDTGKQQNPEMEERGYTMGNHPKDKKSSHGCMLDLITDFKHGRKASDTIFAKNLEKQLEEFELPFLLAKLSEKEMPAKPSVPDFSGLVHSTSIKEAVISFKKLYLRYYLNEFNNNMEVVSKRVGLSKSQIRKILNK